MGGREAVEVAKTVLEVADVAWSAVERCHQHHHRTVLEDADVASLRSENERLRNLLEQNLRLLHDISLSPALLPNLPPDLHQRLVSTVESEGFLESINMNTPAFPFKDPDLEAVEILINEDPSWWVWVTDDDMAPPDEVEEEKSGIDTESYVVVTQEHIVEGVANFMATCILSCPKAKDMSPQELQATLSKALGGMNKVEKMLSIWHAGKMFYTLSTWGLALAGLYRSRAILKLAAIGVHSTSKVVMRAL